MTLLLMLHKTRLSWVYCLNSHLGLVEIDAIKSSDDESEIGDFNLNQKYNVYNAESKVIETVRPNGIPIALNNP
jgi:hypothetical protein